MSLNNELAKERNRAAAERTLMAWIRTCLSLISFGFGLDKIIGAINRSTLGDSSNVDSSVRLLAMGFILTGILAMAAATHQHRKDLRRIRRDDFLYSEEPSIATATAAALIVIGAMALMILLLGARAS